MNKLLNIPGQLLPFLLAIQPLVLFAAPYCDPQSDSACYKRWCQAQGGTTYNDSRGVGCDVGAGGGGGSQPGYGIDPSMQMMQQMMQQMTTSFVQGFQQAQEAARQAEIQRHQQQLQQDQQLRQQVEEQSAKRRQIEEQHRQELEQARQRVLGNLRDVGSEPDLQPRDLSRSKALAVQSVPGTLGRRELRPLESDAIAVADPRSYCGTDLMQRAGTAAATGNLEEAASLSSIASDLMSGAVSLASVNCQLSELANVQGQATQESGAFAQALKKRAFIYSRLYRRAYREVSDYRTISQGLVRANKKRDELQGEISVQQSRMAGLAPDNSTSGTPSALEQARAALRQSERALKDVEREEQELQRTRNDLEKQMGQTRDLFATAQNPEKQDSLFQQLNQ